jgi:hypothetical protein
VLCIYCQESNANAREHYLPRSLGGFEKFAPLLDRLCQKCNEEIGGTAEMAFARQSPEGILRNLQLVKRSRGKRTKPQSVYSPRFAGDEHFSLSATDPETGLELLWQLDEGPGTIGEISQLVVFDANCEAVHHIPVPTAITTGKELFDVFQQHKVAFPVPKLLVIAAHGDEDRIQQMFADWNIKCELQLQKRHGGLIPGPKVYKGRVDLSYFRALAKIGFHYTLKYIPNITGGESCFSPLRNFIKHGSGDPNKFLSPGNSLKRFDERPGHLLTCAILPSGEIVSTFQFFVGSEPPLPRWQLSIGQYPGLLTIYCFSEHFFTLTPTSNGSLKGGEIISLERPLGWGSRPIALQNS